MAVRVARRREESCLDSARSLLSTLQGRPSLANIVKPDWEAKETTSRAVMMLELLDGWLEEGVKVGAVLRLMCEEAFLGFNL